ncbi:neprilysin-like isoform X1, partial [Biomphalaria glabrata]
MNLNKSQMEKQERVTEGVDDSEKEGVNRSEGQKSHSEKYSRTILAVIILSTTAVSVMFAVYQITASMFPVPSTTAESNTFVDDDYSSMAALVNDSIDYSVNPCDDFYQFACGSWMKRQKIPSGKFQTNQYEILSEETNSIVKALLKAPAKEEEHPSIRNAKFYYSSCMNEDLINTMEGSAINEILIQLFGGWPLTYRLWNESQFNLEATVKNLSASGVEALFKFFALERLEDNTKYVLFLERGDFSALDSMNVSNLDGQLDSYELFIFEVGKLLGLYTDRETVVMNEIQQMVAFELELAEIQDQNKNNFSFQETEEFDENLTHNVGENNNYYTIKYLQDMTGYAFDWMKFITLVMTSPEIGVNDVTENEEIYCFYPEYFKKMANVIAKSSHRTVANYLVWKFILNCIKQMTLPRKYLDLYLTHLSYMNESTQRSEVCFDATKAAMKYAVDMMYAKEYFHQDSKVVILNMLRQLQTVMDLRLDANDWMDTKTKMAAQDKNKRTDFQVGYPEALGNDNYLEQIYVNFTFTNDLFLFSFLEVQKELLYSKLRSLRKKPDDQNWPLSITEANALNLQTKNQIIIPAGVLRPPIFHKNFPRSMNYGAIGFLMGHEMVHGFDSDGSRYDKEGHLANWWTNSSRDNLIEKVQCLNDEFSHFWIKEMNATIEGVNNELENIADNGGIKLAYK